MARVRLITDRNQELSPEQVETFDWVVASRGSMIRPFQVLLHSPAVARHAAELGARLRFHSSLRDPDRELVILTAARAHDCAFEWDSHLPLARAAGVREEAIDHLLGGAGALTGSESVFVDFARELCAGSTVSATTFDRARDILGESGVVELSATVGYYTLLAMVMGACDAC